MPEVGSDHIPPPDKQPKAERKVLHESNGYVLVEGENWTADFLGDLPHLIDVRNQVLAERNISNDEVKGIMFNKQINNTVYIDISPDRTKEGFTFVSMSSVDSSFTSTGQLEFARSAYSVLKSNRGYIQRKPCGMRDGNLPFSLSVPKKDFETLTGDFEVGTDLAQVYIDELKGGNTGAISKHLTGNWEVINGMLASEARRELMNGLRFAQIYKQAYGEYPTGQVPVGVHKITDVYMPDGSTRPIIDALRDRFEEKPLEFSMLKTRLLYYERERLKQRGMDYQQVIASLQELKSTLDAQPADVVIQRFLDEDPFVQVAYHTPSFVRLSYRHILAEAQEYRTIRAIAGGEKAKPQAILDTTILLHRTILQELACVAGLDPSQIKYPDKKYKVGDRESIRQMVESWRREVGQLNQDLFRKLAGIEIGKMAQSTAAVNAMGGVLYASLWRSNMIGGSPCDWDWFASSYMEYLPQPQTPRKFERSKFISKLNEQNEHVEDDIHSLCYLLGIEPSGETNKYSDNYLSSYSIARKVLVESGDSDLDPSYKQSLLTESPHPRKSYGSNISFN